MGYLQFVLFLTVSFAFFSATSQQSSYSRDEETAPDYSGTKHGYYEVREGAHMFYWYFEKPHASTYEPDAPLIVWLTTASSTGYGNFGEIGKYDEYGDKRHETWTKYFNVLFIDSPVGVGFSYTDRDSQLVSNNSQAADDLLEFIRSFCADNTRLTKEAPMFIIGESFAAKAALEFVSRLNKKILAGDPEFELIKLAGLVLSSPFVSPQDSLAALPEYLRNYGLVDTETSEHFKKEISEMFAKVETNRSQEAAELLSQMLIEIDAITRKVDLFNVMNYEKRCMACNRDYSQYEIPFFLHPRVERTLFELMNSKVKKSFRGVVPTAVRWNGQVNKVFKKLQKDILASSVGFWQVEELTENGVNVVIVNAQLDALTSTVGTATWIMGYNVTGSNGELSRRRPFTANNELLGYVNAYGNTVVYTLIKAGHYIPNIQSTALLRLVLKETGLKYIESDKV